MSEVYSEIIESYSIVSLMWEKLDGSICRRLCVAKHVPFFV